MSLTYDGLATRYSYDADRRLITLTDPTGEVTSMTYDPVNRPTLIASPIQSFAYAYELSGNPTLKSYRDGTSEAFTRFTKGVEAPRLR